MELKRSIEGVYTEAFNDQNRLTRKTISRSLIMFTKSTLGAFSERFGWICSALYNCVIVDDKLSLSAEPYVIARLLRYNDSLGIARNFVNRVIHIIQAPADFQQFVIAAKCLKQILWKMDIETQLMVASHVTQNLAHNRTFKTSCKLLVSLLRERSPLETRRQIGQIIYVAMSSISDDCLQNYIGGWCSLAAFLLRAFEGETPEALSGFCGFVFQKATENPEHFLHYAFFVFSAVCKSGGLDTATETALLAHAASAIQQTKSPIDCCASLQFLREAFRQSLDHLSDELIGFLITLWEEIRGLPDFQPCIDYLLNIFLLIAPRLPPDGELFVSVLDAFPPKAERSLTQEMCPLLRTYFADVGARPPEVRLAGARAVVRMLAAGVTLRYCHKIETDDLMQMIELALTLLASIGGEIDVIGECLPGRLRAQATVREWFSQFIAGHTA
jgi:hypothetical protein